MRSIGLSELGKYCLQSIMIYYSRVAPAREWVNVKLTCKGWKRAFEELEGRKISVPPRLVPATLGAFMCDGYRSYTLLKTSPSDTMSWIVVESRSAQTDVRIKCRYPMYIGVYTGTSGPPDIVKMSGKPNDETWTTITEQQRGFLYFWGMIGYSFGVVRNLHPWEDRIPQNRQDINKDGVTLTCEIREDKVSICEPEKHCIMFTRNEDIGTPSKKYIVVGMCEQNNTVEFL